MNTTELIEEVRRLNLGPSTTLLNTDDENILAWADRVMDKVVPRIVDVFEEYLIYNERFTLVAGQQKYKIPERAYNGQLRHVSYSGPSQRPVPLRFINRTDKDFFPNSGGLVTAFYLEGDFFAVLGEPTGTLDVAYVFTPNELVTADNFRTVSALPGGNEITLDQAVPSTWSAANIFDIIDSKRSGMPRYWNKGATTVSGTQIIFDSEIAGAEFGRDAIQVGDLVALAGQAGRPMIPEGLHGPLAQATAMKIAQAQGDDALYALLKEEFGEDFQLQIRNIDQRYEGKHVIVNLNSRFRRWGNTGMGRGRRRFF